MFKTVIALRHVFFEDLSAFAPILAEAGYKIEYLDLGVDDLKTSKALEAELVVALGGPIGAYEENLYPYLKDEIDLLERRLATGRPTLGICLGAQLMARALGARVYAGQIKEIGFGAIDLTEEGRRSCLAPFENGSVLHWHGDTFDLPDAAVRLASTINYENQAFGYGLNAIAFQFHPEAGAGEFERWLIGHAAELAQAGKDVALLRAEYLRFRSALKHNAESCLGSWLAELGQGPEDAPH
jgi:GMP synthase (glutamine-hydrolysing)